MTIPEVHLTNHLVNLLYILSIFFFNDTATTEIYTLSLHDALPIYGNEQGKTKTIPLSNMSVRPQDIVTRSEEHTSELQSRPHLVCRLLLEKKKHQKIHLILGEHDHTTLLESLIVHIFHRLAINHHI